MAENTKAAPQEKKDSSAFLTGLVIVILCLFFIIGFLWGLGKVRAMEGSFPPEKTVESVTPDITDKAELCDYISKTVDLAKREKPAFSAKTRFSLDSGSVKTERGGQLDGTLRYIADGFIDCLEEKYPEKQSGFFEGFDGLMQTPSLTKESIDSFVYVYFECGACGARTDKSFERCESCGAADECRSYEPYHHIEIDLSKGDAAAKQLIAEKETSEFIDMLQEEIRDAVRVDGLTLECEKLSAKLQTLRADDSLAYTEYVKQMRVTADITFLGSFSSLGSEEICFDITQTDSYSFTWPCLRLSQQEMTVEPKKSDNLLATLICDDPLLYTVTWTSSDPQLLSVDEEGYFKAGKETGTAVITASFDFGGKTYSDSCTVEVKTPVESVKMSKKRVSLSPGEEYTLQVKVSPGKATVKTVTWYSEDESVATVDENGTVHAVGSGRVTVYVLSDDGYFKSSSEVTVS